MRQIRKANQQYAVADLAGDAELTNGFKGSDEDYLLASLTGNFRLDYFEGFEYGQALLVLQHAQRNGWKSAEFRDKIDAFVGSHVFPTWTIGDWKLEQRARLHPKKWLDDKTTDERLEIALYCVPGSKFTGYGWIAESDGRLERWRPEIRPALPAPVKEELNNETLSAIQNNRMMLERISELERLVRMQRSDLAQLRREKEELNGQLTACMESLNPDDNDATSQPESLS